MKTTLHYIIAILLFSLNATHAFAGEIVGPLNIAYQDKSITCSYNDDKTLLTISGEGDIVITGDGEPIDCGIKIDEYSQIPLYITNLYLRTKVPLTAGKYRTSHPIVLRGTNIFESNASDSQLGIILSGLLRISGEGSLTVKGSENGGAAIDNNGSRLFIVGNACIVAINGKGASSGINANAFNHDKGLFICGSLQSDGSFSQQYSQLKGDVTM